MKPAKDFYYFIEDANGLSWYFDGGVLKKSNQYTNIKHNPDGWQDIEFSFDTNFKYFGLFRTISTPFKFVRQGADILRELAYGSQGNGLNTKTFIRIVQRNPFKDIWVLSYYGQLDFTTFKDDIGVSVTINTIEGGLLQYLNANDSVSYDIVCSENSPEWVKVLFDGVTLYDKYNYSLFKQDLLDIGQTVGAVFLTNEGDSVGIIHGDPTPEPVNSIEYLTTSANYLFKSVSPVTVRISGSVIFDLRDGVDGGVNPQLNSALYIRTSNLAQYNLVPLDWHNPKQEYFFDMTFDLAAEEKIFLLYLTGGFASLAQLLETKFSISFNSKNTPSSAYAIRPMQLFQSLVDKMTGQPGKFIFESNYFTNIRPNVVTTCGDALRNTDKTSPNAAIKEYYIATTFEEAFNAYALVPMALKIQDNVLRIDPISDLYGGEEEIFSLGEISNVSIEPIKDRLANSLKIGYPDQNYNERAGKYETNSTQQWKLPTDVVKNEFNQIVRYRSDPFGIEFNRSNFTGKDSTDNGGDKTPFLVMIDDSNSAPFMGIFIEGGIDTTRMTVLRIGDSQPDASLATRFAPGTVFNLRYSLFNDGNYRAIALDGAVVTVQWIERGPKTITRETGLNQVTFDNFTLYRETYTSISGVLDATIFNVPLTPKHRLLAWGSYWKSVFYQQPTDQITLTTAAKNTQLMYTLEDGTTFIESAPITVGDLPEPLFLPYQMNFKTPVFFTFLEIMSHLSKGVVHAAYEGRDLYLMPIGKMSMKPATNEAQDWQLYISPRTSLMTLLSLSNIGTIINLDDNSLYMSNLQPIHWVEYNYQKKPGIQHLQAWQDWVENRYPFYPSKERYYQKWLTSDLIKVWFVSKGIANLTLMIYDDQAQLVTSYPLNTLPSAAIQSPNLIKYASFPANTLTPGDYLFAINSGAQRVLVSEWQRIGTYSTEHVDRTMLIKYRHSYNRSDYYQELGELQLRVEAQQGIPKDLAEVIGYVDDQRSTELLNGKTYETRQYYFGFPFGVPDWMQKKLNLITTLDTVSIEDVQVVRGSDAQLDRTEIAGYNLTYSSIELLTADNNSGVVIDEVTGDEVSDGTIIINIDPEGFGNDENVIQVTVNG